MSQDITTFEARIISILEFLIKQLIVFVSNVNNKFTFGLNS